MEISKKEFIKIINRLKETNDFVNDVNNKARELDEAIESDFFNAMSLSISHENIVVKLLEKIFDDKDLISWWIYERNYGRDKGTVIWEEDGKEID